jgi:hypothetical protein
MLSPVPPSLELGSQWPMLALGSKRLASPCGPCQPACVPGGGEHERQHDQQL